MTPKGMGIAVGDLVTYSDDELSTGGILYQVVADEPPVKPNGAAWTRNIKETGAIRLRPFFEFLPTGLGSNPKGKARTVIIHYNRLQHVGKPDLAQLAAKYAQLGLIIRDLAVKGGMEASPEDPQPPEAAHPQPTE